jgi:two-component system cell cycle response regulator CpdR
MARILLAEDDDSLRGFLARALGRAGHQVCAVGDGDAALAALDENDLLVADIVMPGTDGIEVARRAGAGSPDLRIMLITGFAAMVVRAQSAGIGRAKVMAKPMHLRELVDRVEEVLA